MYAATSTARQFSRRRPRAQWPVRFRNGAIGVSAAALLLLGFAHAVEGGAPSAYETITVEPGDTLWTVAADRYPGTDIRNKVIQIRQANHLSGVQLHPGDSIRVPSR